MNSDIQSAKRTARTAGLLYLVGANHRPLFPPLSSTSSDRARRRHGYGEQGSRF
jgi:hypothetical protein